MTDFTHLHTHSMYSLPIGLDGFNSPAELVARAKELGQTSLALTDHGSLYGVYDFAKAAKKAGIKAIIGSEGYVSEKDHTLKDATNKQNAHLLMLAMNQTGYQNLLKITTIAHTEGFYYRPRISHRILEQHHEGIIFTSACIGSEINLALRDNKPDKARDLAAFYRNLVGDRFYLELQNHPAVPIVHDLNLELIRIGNELGIPFVATSDAHFAVPSEAEAHRFLKATRWGMNIDDFCTKIETELDTSFALNSANDLWPYFKPYGAAGMQAFENTLRIADRCHFTLGAGTINLPPVHIPEGHTAESYLREVATMGLKRHQKDFPAYQDRLAYELDVINQTGFPAYMLIVWDIVQYARSHGIPCLPRGSAGASLVLYCLGISDVDPIENKLLFERFLSPERLEMPDIDIDFADSERAKVVEYITDTYGRDCTAQIITFGTLKPKAAIRDAARTLSLPIFEADSLANLVHEKAGSMDSAYRMNAEMKSSVRLNPVHKQIATAAEWIENTVRNVGTHACGLVVSSQPLDTIVPLQPTKDGGLMAAFEGPTLAELGLLKMDILGSTNLSVVADTMRQIQARHGVSIDLKSIPLDDKKVFDALGRGETANVFQLEGAGITRYLVELKPTRVEDIHVMGALYRPGPLEQIPVYIHNKNNPKDIKYLHPTLKPILEETYGVIVYQEQIMLLLQAMAGYTLGEAYIVLKAIGKKKKDLMATEEPRFKQGCVKHGLTQAQADHVWDLIQPFAGYSFNRPHSTLYGLLSYQTAWFKVNYPVEYMQACISHEMGDIASVATACDEARRLGITMLPPDVNHSGQGFLVESDTAIRFGLSAIKNVGDSAVESIVNERTTGGLFEGFDDFIARTNKSVVNKKALESLVQAGACDGFGNRHALLAELPELLKLRADTAKHANNGMVSLFGDDKSLLTPKRTPKSRKPLEDTNDMRIERLSWERNLLGFYLTNHPVVEALDGIEPHKNWLNLGSASVVKPQTLVAGVALVKTFRKHQTKKGDTMASITLSDPSGECSAVIFPKVYASLEAPSFLLDTVVGYRGRIDDSRGDVQIIINEIGDFDVAAKAPKIQTKPVELPQLEQAVQDDSVYPEDLNDYDQLGIAYTDPDRDAFYASDTGFFVLDFPRLDIESFRAMVLRVKDLLETSEPRAIPIYVRIPAPHGGHVILDPAPEWYKDLPDHLLEDLAYEGVSVSRRYEPFIMP